MNNIVIWHDTHHSSLLLGLSGAGPHYWSIPTAPPLPLPSPLPLHHYTHTRLCPQPTTSSICRVLRGNMTLVVFLVHKECETVIERVGRATFQCTWTFKAVNVHSGSQNLSYMWRWVRLGIEPIVYVSVYSQQRCWWMIMGDTMHTCLCSIQCVVWFGSLEILGNKISELKKKNFSLGKIMWAMTLGLSRPEGAKFIFVFIFLAQIP